MSPIRHAMKKSKRITTGKIFAENLKTVLDQRDLSAKQAALLAGVPASTLSQWLGGSMPLDMESVYRFCQATGTDFQWLLVNKTEPLKASIEDVFEYAEEPSISGIFIVELKRLKPKDKK